MHAHSCKYIKWRIKTSLSFNIFRAGKAIGSFIIPLFFNLLFMRRISLAVLLLSFTCIGAFAQHGAKVDPNFNPDNIYSIKQRFLYHVLHNPTEKEKDADDDNDLTRFNRWFNDMEPRCYPTGNLPRPDVVLTATEAAKKNAKKGAGKTTTTYAWQPFGPMTLPTNNNGIGRINCIVVGPNDTNTLYVGAACGGVFISHDGGNTWTSNSDGFPSLSIADIAVNPIHPDTLYAATGDGYGYETGGFGIFWGGLYSAGVMKSTDGGASWHTTGLSYLQTNRDIIQRLLIHPAKTNILLAATRNGLMRTTDAGATWSNVDTGHVFSMAFRPGSPDTVYAIVDNDLRISYDAGATWQTRYASFNPANDRCTIGVSPVSPNAIWVLNAAEDVKWSHNGGLTFTTTNRPDTARFYGYYDRVFAVSPTDSTYLLAFGMLMAVSRDAGASWDDLTDPTPVHVDNHAVAFNPLHPETIWCGNDGGISVTRDGGITWKNLGDGLMISQIYRMATSREDPNVMLCGLQDNGTFRYDGTEWLRKSGGDGEDCAIHLWNDYLQISSSQHGWFNISFDRGVSFSHLDITSENGSWTAPVALDPLNESIMYFGYENIHATYDHGATFVEVTHDAPFPDGATTLVMAPSDNQVLYASDRTKLIRTINGGSTWSVVTGSLPTASVAIMRVEVDPRNPMRVYVTTSGYEAGQKVFVSNTGGNTWTNISSNLPNLPANCIAIDSSTPGALFVGTDIGVYYTDSSQTGWTLYGSGLPNVIANDLDINYTNYKIRVATFGRGVWECRLKKDAPNAVNQVTKPTNIAVQVYPNPTKNNWQIIFTKQKPTSYSVKVADVTGRTVQEMTNSDRIDASALATGVYMIEVTFGTEHYAVKAVKE